MSPKMAETTAELQVSIAVEKKYKVCSDDVESSLMEHEEELQQKQEFIQHSTILTNLMGRMTSACKPR
jgi:hypothetical protein